MHDGLDHEIPQLLEKARDGNVEAYGQVYERYAPVIFRFLYSHLDDRFDAEDLTEEVFLRAWRSLPNYLEQGTPFIAFLFRVARNALIDHYRRTERSKNTPLVEDEFLRDSSPGPAEATQAEIERREVREKLGRLRDEYRQVLTLRFLAEMSPDETAQAMGKSPGSIRVLQHRALAALKKMFEPSKQDDDARF